MEKVPAGAARRSNPKIRFFDNSDASWSQYGRDDPYYGVFSGERFRTKNLNETSLKEFFDSGEIQIDRILRDANLYTNGALATSDALDFGCGVGRLVVPLARRFRSVVGIDVSNDYLAEAGRNCERRGLANVEFANSVTSLLGSGRRFDLIHSSIVFNHIPWPRGREIIGEMFQLLRPGGMIAIQVLHWQEIGRLHRLARAARKFLPFHWLLNILQGRLMLEPLMQSNEYPLDELVALLHRQGAKAVTIQPQTNENREHWAFVFCRKETT